MPTLPIFSTPIVACNNPAPAGGSGAPAPLTSPIVYDTPGVHAKRLPPGLTSVTVQQWGGGGLGGMTNGSTGAEGGGSGAFAKYVFTGALVADGSVFTITVGDGGTALGAAADTKVTTSGGAPHVVSGAGDSGDDGGGAGVNVVTAGAGLSVTTNTAGSAGAAHSGNKGGAGGNSPGGYAGGAGGLDDKSGQDGTARGAGGGGSGQDEGSSPVGGNGAPGYVVISWV